jgi:outer membrane assembly lipoprotein YfgL
VRRIACAAVALALAGCTFLGLAPEKPKPKVLDPITPQPVARAAWNQRIGAVNLPLTVAIADGAFIVASSDGQVAAFAAADGRELWRTQIGNEIGAGVGSDGKTTAVVTRNSELVALSGGKVKWRKPVGTRVVTAPLVAGGRIFVLAIDRSVHAFDADDGMKLWSAQRPGDPLTLAQTGVLSAFRNTLVAGQGPRLAGLDPANGNVRWEVPIGSPRGANEVERLADLVGPVLRIGDVLCARAFQAAVGCVNADRGSLVWTKNVGGTDAIAGDADFVFGADASDRLTAWRVADGTVAWTSEAVLNHGLSAPAVLGGSVAFGAADGMIHFFSRDKGEAQLRLQTDGNAVVAPLAVANGTLLAVTQSGGLHAFRAP